jgi:phenylacetate-CoA ligase
LIRYEIMDFAEVGAACPCGRGLPVLKRIVGRSRNLIRLPDGSRHWPSFPTELWAGVAPIRQIQIVQRDTSRIEVCLVADRPLADGERAELARRLNERLGHPFEFDVNEVERIERSAGGKYEDFIGLGNGETSNG